MKVGDKVIGTVTSPAGSQGTPASVDHRPTGPIVDMIGDDLLVYTQFGAVWRIPAKDCTVADADPQPAP